MSFASDVRAWTEKVKALEQAALVGLAEACRKSIVEGSPVTGAPGQPIGETGELRRSWVLDYPTPDVASIRTADPAAPVIEEGMGKYGPLQLRSPVGGFHSLKLTIAGAPQLLEHVLRGLPG